RNLLASSATVNWRPMLVRSGPTDLPRPFAVWQSPHCPLPKKNCSPAAASPKGDRPLAELPTVPLLAPPRELPAAPPDVPCATPAGLPTAPPGAPAAAPGEFATVPPDEPAAVLDHASNAVTFRERIHSARP